MSQSVHEHRHSAPEGVRAIVLTASDTRTTENDRSGAFIMETLRAAGHEIVDYAIISDDADRIRPALDAAMERDDVDAVIITGGTGISPRDVTTDVVVAVPKMRILPGFGELFRMLSFEEVGAAALLSRATAGVCEGTFVAALPGSRNAVRLAMERLIIPELGHIVAMARPERAKPKS